MGRPRKNPAPTPVDENQVTFDEICESSEPVKLKGRGGKYNFPNAQMELVEPGDNAKYLRHALATRNLPPIDTKDPQQVKDRIDWYFNHCAENEMKPTVKGFCNALKIDKSTIFRWKQGEHRADTHQQIILDAYAILEELWENYMQNGKINPVSGIFLGKNNFDYSDKQEYVVTPNVGAIQESDPVALEAKYAELPED